MRRRWLLILGGVGVIGVATVIALSLLIHRPPFRFLGGHEPLPADSVSIGLSDYDRWYSFEGDYGAVVSKARAELVPLGYNDLSGQNVGSFLKGGPDGGSAGGAPRG